VKNSLLLTTTGPNVIVNQFLAIQQQKQSLLLLAIQQQKQSLLPPPNDLDQLPTACDTLPQAGDLGNSKPRNGPEFRQDSGM
jgi:hypothetical protein